MIIHHEYSIKAHILLEGKHTICIHITTDICSAISDTSAKVMLMETNDISSIQILTVFYLGLFFIK